MDSAPMTVLRKTEYGMQKVIIDLYRDVLYIEQKNERLLYHTENGIYYGIQSLADLEELDDFWKLDGCNVVNMTKIRRIGRHLRVFFTPTPSKESKSASICWMMMKVLGSDIKKKMEENKTS
ncbi:LytTR family transcriptional regulator DNA-binding domain-containing protein [Paenibacillus piri]|nr:LytTR family transcriptional regulator DNA-binding domain-containing protein [Paenibacillus piri]